MSDKKYRQERQHKLILDLKLFLDDIISNYSTPEDSIGRHLLPHVRQMNDIVNDNILQNKKLTDVVVGICMTMHYQLRRKVIQMNAEFRKLMILKYGTEYTTEQERAEESCFVSIAKEGLEENTWAEAGGQFLAILIDDWNDYLIRSKIIDFCKAAIENTASIA